MKKNDAIDWTIIMDDNSRNCKKPSNPHLQYSDQEHAWYAIFTGCQHIEDLQSILELTVRGTRHMEVASFAWKQITEIYDPKTPASFRQHKAELNAEIANFDGNVPRYRNAIMAKLANLGQHAPQDSDIIYGMLFAMLHGPVCGDWRMDKKSWSSFVVENVQHREEDLESIFKLIKCHANFWEDNKTNEHNQPTSISSQPQQTITATQRRDNTQSHGMKTPTCQAQLVSRDTYTAPTKTPGEKRGREDTEHNKDEDSSKDKTHSNNKKNNQDG